MKRFECYGYEQSLSKKVVSIVLDLVVKFELILPQSVNYLRLGVLPHLRVRCCLLYESSIVRRSESG